MLEIIIAIVASFVSLAIGLGLGYFIRKQVGKNQASSVEAKAEKILNEAKNKEQELLLKTKEKAIKIIDEAKVEENQRRLEISQIQKRLETRESMFDKQLLEFEERKERMQKKVEEIQAIKTRVDEAYEKALLELQRISSLDKEEAKALLFERVEKQVKDDLMGRIIKLEHENSEVYESKAREIVIDAIQRCASDHSSETTSTAVNLPSDEMKGRIIGKDGRNIKTIEKMTGCELIIDDTPDMILVSGFSPIRRRVCQLALEKLIKDGRIQPARIEEFIEESKKELALDIKKAGEEALYKLGITGLDPKLVSIVGRLKYRTSYGQSVLNHSIEVAQLCGMIAEELGVDAAKAKKAGFFHDIGKAVDQDTQGSHPEIGYTILKKFGMDEDIADAAAHHHDDKPEKLLTQIAKSADAISASRVGARRDTYEQFVARLEELEKTASDFPGVDKVYAIQAGREVRIFVKSDQVDDYQAYNLAKDIARKIENELQYPGEIRVNVIRETRIIEYAR
ncbi:MAG: Ribonuclease Y [Candidatus Magasanikbacteria bacterium GW2011_GWC2_37_14]|uniref:Ribonuclease Y n=1 Tax=Candidatus Magasanikbacteria bacterium GW2011_GWC2_37_14 TaxID=1619046 RepID=A0A0G0GNJ5_9BACT|nr:MAG: Ribonuclease Y [Candidatus Magasanikbacteria bacterium GW2011_GWC2_37_14]